MARPWKAGIKVNVQPCVDCWSVACLTEDPRVENSMATLSHTFLEIDQEKISTFIVLPSADSRRVVVSYK